MPVGSTSHIAQQYRSEFPETDVSFACSPENLRLGKALSVFRNPGRIVVGVSRASDRERLSIFLTPFCSNLVWMSVESAEMTKHALNAFLGNSVAFMNEIARVCEQTGADAKEVEQGLKTDERIGPRAYLSPGGAFAGGTLARDLVFLSERAAQTGVHAPLFSSILESNEFHKNWPLRKVEAMLGDLAGKRIAVLGLTYKPGTDTLRRSAAVGLCRSLHSRGATVHAFDPVVKKIPEDLKVELCSSAASALSGCDAAVVATEWPQFRELKTRDFVDNMRTPIVIDANRFLEASLPPSPPLRYVAVGKAERIPCS
jgi:UDPglucose 6-dehydrogenase